MQDRKQRVDKRVGEGDKNIQLFLENFPGIAYQALANTLQPFFFVGQVEEISGFQPSEFLEGKVRWKGLVYPDDRAYFTEQTEKLRSTPSYIAQSEYRIVRKDGKILWVRDIGWQVYDPPSKEAIIQGTIYDVSERKHLELALQKQKDFLSSVLESDPEGVSVLDPQLKIMRVNKVMEKWYQQNLPLVGKLCYVAYQNRSEPCDPCPTLRCLRTGKTEREIVPGLPGSTAEWLDLLSYPLVDRETGEIVGVVEFVRDFTERKRAEILQDALYHIAALANSDISLEKLYRSIHQIIGELMPAKNFYVALYHPDREMLSFPYFVDEVDQTAEDIELGKGLTAYVIKTGEPLLIYENKHNELIEKGVLELVGPPSPVWLGVPLKSKHGVFGAMVVQHYQDINAYGEREKQVLTFVSGQIAAAIERKRAEEELQSLNFELEKRVAERTAQLEAAYRELEAFSYSVSHDLRGPLRGINGFSQALIEDYADVLDTGGLDYLRSIRVASQRLSKLIDDLLKLSRVSRSEIQKSRIDLCQISQDIVDELRTSEPDREVEFIRPESLWVMADNSLLSIAMENLLGNAWKFTSKHSSARIELGSENRDGQIVYFVRDDGAGFNMAYADKLFRAFQRLHSESDFEGTGIGLAIVQRIIHRHGGRVWAESAIEQGATFYFTLA